MTCNKICVAHLVRYCNDISLFKNFIESYKRHSAGIPHDLIIILKGFSENSSDINIYTKLLVDLDYQIFYINDDGFDITAYHKLANQYNYYGYCFLNSNSQIIADDWLNLLNEALIKKNIGLVGATGSYQSFATPMTPIKTFKNHSRRKEGLIWATGVFMIIYLNYLKHILKYRIYFDKFPNYHIRTNAFMIKRTVFLNLCVGEFLTKLDAYKFESGKNGLSKQIVNMGLDILVVGKNGKFYKKEEWSLSNTFWQGNQSNLLVSDNQTKAYENSNEESKELYRYHAWGNLDIIKTKQAD